MKLMHRSVCSWIACVFIAGGAQAGDKDDSGFYNEYTIRVSDIPPNAPKQKDYPASPLFHGTPAAAKIQSPRSRNFRTVIRGGAKNAPDFAGHYTIVRWGCGTECVQIAIVDAISGAVYHPPNLESFQVNNVDVDAMEEKHQELFDHALGSRLLTVIGGINEDPKLRGVSYFEWKDNTLRRIRFVPKPDEWAK